MGGEMGMFCSRDCVAGDRARAGRIGRGMRILGEAYCISGVRLRRGEEEPDREVTLLGRRGCGNRI